MLQGMENGLWLHCEIYNLSTRKTAGRIYLLQNTVTYNTFRKWIYENSQYYIIANVEVHRVHVFTFIPACWLKTHRTISQLSWSRQFELNFLRKLDFCSFNILNIDEPDTCSETILLWGNRNKRKYMFLISQIFLSVTKD